MLTSTPEHSSTPRGLDNEPRRGARARLAEAPACVACDAGQADRVITYELVVEDVRSRSAEEWARATFEGAPAALRWFLTVGWRFVLGLRLARESSPAYVLGWSIAERRDERIILVGSSRLITGHNIVALRDGAVVWTTLVRYHKTIAQPIWRLTELVHRIVLPYIFTRAGRTMRKTPSATCPPAS